MLKISFTRKAISLFLCIALIIPSGVAVFAENSSDITNVNIQEFQSSVVDPNELFYGTPTPKSFSYAGSNLPYEFNNVNLSYNENLNELTFSAIVDKSTGDEEILACGIMYNREHVNYPVCYIGDLQTIEGNFTIVYFEIYNDNGQAKLNVFFEENNTGNMYKANVYISSDLLNIINNNAINIKMTEEQYMDLVIFNSKSPNHAIEKDINKSITFNELAVIDDNSPKITTFNTKQNEWIRLLNNIKSNTGINQNYSSYSLPQTFFESLNTTAGQYQWDSYTPSPTSFEYRMVRCALYQAYSGTYSFWFSIIRSYKHYSGDMSEFSFGFIQVPGQSTDVNMFSCRTELNTSNKTLRYVADRGLKFFPEISMELSTGSFEKVNLNSYVQETNNSLDLVKFAIGFTKVGTAVSVFDLIIQYGGLEIFKNTSGEKVWTRTAGTQAKLVTGVSSKQAQYQYQEAPLYLYGDHLNIVTRVSSSPSITYNWSYSVRID